MKAQILGPIEVYLDDRVPLGGPTQRRILGLLILRRNAVVSVDQLIDITWPSDAPDRADRNIRSYIHRLRTALGDEGDRIETIATGYRLRLSGDELDADEFDRLSAASARLEAYGESAEALIQITKAQSLWRGTPFGEFADEPWAQTEVARLEEVRLAGVERHAAVLLGLGRCGDVVGLLEPHTRDHPLREQPRLLLMRALAGSGRQAEALRSFQSYRRILIDEVGVDPSPVAVELDRSIAQGKATALPDHKDLAGIYELNEQIGKGAFGVVHRATQRSLQREVAVKIIRAELANEPEFIRRFETEAKLVARVEHPNVVPLYDFWRDPDRAYLVMRYMPGGSLQQCLEAGPLSIEETLELVDDVAGGLAAAHAAGLIHRDVKPANILFDNNRKAYLSDFGIALELLANDAMTVHEADLSSSFASPEQLRNEPASPGTDIYGLAIVAYAALVGQAPFANSSNRGELINHVLNDPVPSLCERRPELPIGVDQVLAIATAKHPGARYRSAPGFAASLRAAVEATDALPADQLQSATPGANPYKGLRAFDETDTAQFYGRRRLIDELVASLALPDRRMLAVIGPSGSGKSSVVRAGLLPALRDDAIPGSASWFTVSMTPGTYPFEALETALLRIAVNPPAQLIDQLRSGPRGILQAAQRVVPDGDSSVLIVIDQFEELFTSERSTKDAGRFLDGLVVAVSEPESPVRLVITLRADFYDRPLRHPAFAPLVKAATVAVTPLAPDELEAVITEPAASVGVGFEAGVVSQIMADVAGQPGSLPLLQYALTQTYDQSDQETIRLVDYETVGGIEGALAQRAEELHVAANTDEQIASRRIFGRLVTLGEGSEDTRRRATLAEFGTSDAAAVVLKNYGAARLLSFDHDPATREPIVEVSHEALLTSWPRLRAWLNEDRDGIRLIHHLNSSAGDWDRSARPESELYRGGRLEAAEDWAEDHASDLGPIEKDYLGASVALREREVAAQRQRFDDQAHTNQKLRGLLASVAALLALALVAGGVAFQQRSTARDAAFDAETGRLVATAQSLAATNPRVAMLLAVAAHQREETPATLGSLQAILSTASPLVGHLGWGTDYIDVEWLVNDRIVGIREDGLDLFDVDTGELLDTIQLDIGRGDFSPYLEDALVSAASDAAAIAVAVGSAALVFDVGDQLELRSQRQFDLRVSSAALSADSKTYLAATVDNVLTVWDKGGTLFASDLEDAENWVEQATPVLGAEIQFAFLFEPLPIRTVVSVSNGSILAATGAYIRRLDWSGETLNGPTYLSREWQPGVLIPTGAQGLVESEGRLVVMATNSITDLDLSTGWPEQTINQAVAGTLGGGSPDILAGFGTSGPTVYGMLSDGSLSVIDPKSGGRETLLDVGLEVSTGMATSADSDRLVIAHPQGIAVVSVGGAGPISEALPRAPISSSVTISRDGRFAVVGPPGTVGPVIVLRHEVDGTWEVESELPIEGVFASAPPDFNDPLIIVSDDPEGQYTYSLAGEHPQLVGADLGPGAASAGAISPTAMIDAIAHDKVYVRSVPSFETIHELEKPPGTPDFVGLSGVRFDPTGEFLLVSNTLGRSQLYSTESWLVVNDDALAEEDIALGYWNTDGSLLATASSGGQIAIRDGQTFEVITTMVGAAGTSNSWNDGALIFSDDNSLLLTNFDGPGRLWDVATGQQIGIDFPLLQGTNSGVNFGETLQLITANETSALVWNLNTDEWAGIACTSAGSNLSADEWAQWGPRDEDHHALCEQFPLP